MKTNRPLDYIGGLLLCEKLKNGVNAMREITIKSLYDDLAKEADTDSRDTLISIIEWMVAKQSLGATIFFDDEWMDYVAFKDGEFIDSYAGMVTAQDYLYEELAKAIGFKSDTNKALFDAMQDVFNFKFEGEM